MAGLTEKARTKIFEEELIRAEARFKGSLKPKPFLLFLLVMAVILGAVFYFDGKSSDRAKVPLASLDNEIQLNLALLQSVENEYKGMVKNVPSEKMFVKNLFNQEVLIWSIKWQPDRFADLDIQDRLELSMVGAEIMKANEEVAQFSAPESKVSRVTWTNSVNKEISAIEKYFVQAAKVQASLDASLKAFKDLKNVRLKATPRA